MSFHWPDKMSLNGLTQEMKEIRKRYRKQLTDVWVDKYFPAERELCFLIANFKHGYEEVVKRMEDYAKFHDQNNLDKILEEPFEEYEDALYALPCIIHGIDKDGSLVVYVDLFEVDIDFCETNPEACKRYCINILVLLERLKHEYTKKTGRVMMKHTIVMDVEDLDLNTLRRLKKSVGELSKVCHGYYPETLNRIICINANWKFTLYESFCTMFMEKSTIAKIQVVGEDFIGDLKRYIPMNQIPSSYNGKSEMKDDNGSVSVKELSNITHIHKDKEEDDIEELEKIIERAEKNFMYYQGFTSGIMAGIMFYTIILFLKHLICTKDELFTEFSEEL